MLVYAIIMFIVAIIFAGVSIAIYKGKTHLIHDYHQTNVTNKKAYGKAFGKALLVISTALLLSGIVGLLEGLEVVSVLVLVVDLSIGTLYIVAVQRKYNKGVF